MRHLTLVSWKHLERELQPVPLHRRRSCSCLNPPAPVMAGPESPFLCHPLPPSAVLSPGSGGGGRGQVHHGRSSSVPSPPSLCSPKSRQCVCGGRGGKCIMAGGLRASLSSKPFLYSGHMSLSCQGPHRGHCSVIVTMLRKPQSMATLSAVKHLYIIFPCLGESH